MKAALESGLNVRKSSRAWSSAKLHHQKLKPNAADAEGCEEAFDHDVSRLPCSCHTSRPYNMDSGFSEGRRCRAAAPYADGSG